MFFIDALGNIERRSLEPILLHWLNIDPWLVLSPSTSSVTNIISGNQRACIDSSIITLVRLWCYVCSPPGLFCDSKTMLRCKMYLLLNDLLPKMILSIAFKRIESSTTSLLFRPYMGLLPDTHNWWLLMRRECRERFPRDRGLAIPTCIATRAWRTARTCCDACLDHKLAVPFEVGGEENVLGIPGSCTTRNLCI